MFARTLNLHAVYDMQDSEATVQGNTIFEILSNAGYTSSST